MPAENRGFPEKIVFFVSDGVGDSHKPTACTKRPKADASVAWQLNVRMRLFQLGLAFKDENPSDRILRLTATAKTPSICMYGS